MPGFTAVAALTLAIGIGANTAIFSVVEGVLLKPLPYPRSEELVVLDHAAPGLNITSAGAAPFLYFVYREEGRVFQDVGLWNTGTVSVTGLAEPEEVRTLFSTDGVLPMLGVQPMLGRVFTRTDGSPGSPETVVLTAGYWRTKFGGDRAAIGRTLMVDSLPREIIGVLPDSFRFLDRNVSIVLPYRLDRSKVFLGQFSYSAIARLKPRATIAQASADVTRLIPVSLTRFPPFPGGSVKMFEEARITPNVRSLKDDLVGDVRTVLWVLTGTIGLVLLIACANVANLLLVRAESRQQELAIRAALGAGTGRIARELLVESVTLGLLGGAIGLGLAFGAIRVLVALAPGRLPRVADIALDVPALLFTLAISIVVGLLFGAIPVFKYAGLRVGSMLRGGGRTASASRERHRTRNTLVVVQVALALVLLIGSGLMFRTFHVLSSVHPGFVRPGEVQTFRLSIPDSQIKEEVAVARMHQTIGDKIAAVPGVASVALASTVTMSGEGWHDPLFAQDRAYSDAQMPPIRLFKFVSPGYMHTMGGSLVAGRDFTWADIHQQRPVAMVSESLARELWRQPGGRPRQARPPVYQGRLARGGRGRLRHARRWPEQEGTDGRVLAAPDGRLLPGRRAPHVRPARRLLRGSQQPHRVGRVRERVGSGRMVDQPESSAGWSSNARGDLRRVARADVVHARHAGDRGRDGTAARRRRDLRRDLLLRLAANARDRHPDGARGADADGAAHVRRPRLEAGRNRRRDWNSRRGSE